MMDLSKLFPNGSVDQDFILIVLILAHIVVAVTLILIYIIRKNRRSKRDEVIKDTIDALLEEHSLERSNITKEPKQTAEQKKENKSILEELNDMSKRTFIEYLGDYFETADYKVTYLPDTPSTQSRIIPHMIINRNGQRGVVLTDQPKTKVTGLPLIRSYYNQNHDKISHTDSLIVITTGTLSPKAIEFCKSLKRPIIVINGQQLATSVNHIETESSE